MPDILVLVPVYRELAWIQGAFADQWKFLHEMPENIRARLSFRFCVWQRSGESQLTNALNRVLEGWPDAVRREIVSGAEGEPSVVGSLQLGVGTDALPPYLLICPIDCCPGLEGLREALSFVQDAARSDAPGSSFQGRSSERPPWAVFPKAYDRGGLLRVSASLQNAVIAPILGVVCWTNLFVVPSDAFGVHFSRGLFLEDLRANRALRKAFGKPYHFKSKTLVSSRRYVKRGPLRQMMTNVFIFLQFLVGRYDEDALRGVHEGQRSASRIPESLV